jgi:uncharacterized protein (DUF736 family)
MSYERDPNELGALWEKTSARGVYMTGTINGQAVVLFRNDRKPAGSKAPDWRVMKPKPKPETSAERDDDIGF